MSELFDRAFRVVLGTTEVDALAGANSGLRLRFAIQRDEKRTPNSAEISLYGLSPERAAELASKSEVSVSLEAGYVGAVGQLFLGDLRTVRNTRDGASRVCTISGGDGEALLRTARINRTFRAGTPVGDVLRGLASALGVERGNVASAAAGLQTQRLPRAETLCGLVYDELEEFCRTYGLRWSVQDSALQVRTGNEPVRGTQGPLLRADTGLIGEVEVEAQGKAKKSRRVIDSHEGQVLVRGSCALNPDLIPGVPFRVEAEAFTGNLVCLETVHRGDSHSVSEWSVDWVGRPY